MAKPPHPSSPVGEHASGVTRVVAVAELRVEGLRRVSESWLREQLALHGLFVGARIRWPDDPGVAQARQILVGSGEFSRVTFRLEPIETYVDVVRVVLSVEERAASEIATIYGGVSEYTPWRAGLRLTSRNVGTRAMHATIGGVVGARPDASSMPSAHRQMAFSLGLEAPGALRSGRMGLYATSLFADAQEPDPDWLKSIDPREMPSVGYRRLSGSAGVTIPARPELSVRAGVRGELLQGRSRLGGAQTDVSDATTYPIARHWHALAAIEAALIWDDREKLGRHASGSLARLDLVWAPPVAQDEYDYLRLQASLGRDFRLPWRHWLEVRFSVAQLYGQAPRFEALYPGDFTTSAPGRELGLIFSTRQAFDWLRTGIDVHGLANFAGRTQIEYVAPLFVRRRPAFLRGAEAFVSVGGFGVRGDAAKRRARAVANQPTTAFGVDVDAGLRLFSAWGTCVLSLSNLVTRVPL